MEIIFRTDEFKDGLQESVVAVFNQEEKCLSFHTKLEKHVMDRTPITDLQFVVNGKTVNVLGGKLHIIEECANCTGGIPSLYYHEPTSISKDYEDNLWLRLTYNDRLFYNTPSEITEYLKENGQVN